MLSKKVDIYAFGILMYVLATGKNIEGQSDLINKTIHGTILNNNWIKEINSSIKNIIIDCCNFYPEKRPTAAILSSKFFNENESFNPQFIISDELEERRHFYQH